MKFNAEELKQFKKDLDASLKELSNKYNIDITLGKIAVIDDMFSIRLNADHFLRRILNSILSKHLHQCLRSQQRS